MLTYLKPSYHKTNINDAVLLYTVKLAHENY
jgi:hypothetical protein